MLNKHTKKHKKFIKELGNKRMATVGEVVSDINVVTLKDNMIMDFDTNMNQLERIFYTVDYLLENNLVTQKKWEKAPDFNPLPFMEDGGGKKYRANKIHAMREYLNDYWGRKLLVRPIFFKMIDNGYKTDKELRERSQLWLTIIVAILSPFLTALFLSVFPYLIQSLEFFD